MNILSFFYNENQNNGPYNLSNEKLSNDFYLNLNPQF